MKGFPLGKKKRLDHARAGMRLQYYSVQWRGCYRCTALCQDSDVSDYSDSSHTLSLGAIRRRALGYFLTPGPLRVHSAW